MPTPYLKKLASEGKGSLQALEKKWSEAKARAASEGKAENYAYIMGIFKNMVSASGLDAALDIAIKNQAEVRSEEVPFQTISLDAAARLLASLETISINPVNGSASDLEKIHRAMRRIDIQCNVVGDKIVYDGAEDDDVEDMLSELGKLGYKMHYVTDGVFQDKRLTLQYEGDTVTIKERK